MTIEIMPKKTIQVDDGLIKKIRRNIDDASR